MTSLQIVAKIPKAQHIKPKNLIEKVNKMSEKDEILDFKTLYVPANLLCAITGDIMTEPVTLTSGRSFEKESIEMYFQIQKEKAARVIRNADSDIEEEQNLQEEDFMVCPVTNQKVDPTILVPNSLIKASTERFLKENPWAFEFNPKQKFQDIIVWQ